MILICYSKGSRALYGCSDLKPYRHAPISHRVIKQHSFHTARTAVLACALKNLTRSFTRRSSRLHFTESSCAHFIHPISHALSFTGISSLKTSPAEGDQTKGSCSAAVIDIYSIPTRSQAVWRPCHTIFQSTPHDSQVSFLQHWVQ